MYDVNGNEFIDYIGSWGPHLFGHNPPFIKDAILKAIENGTSFGAPTELEVKMAKLITEMVPSVEMVRMVNSGTEATMSAVRTARGYTGKEKFIKFDGCYHGHADYFLIKAGSGALTLGVPTSPGVTKGNAADTLLADYNNIESVKRLVNANKNEIAAVIIEPVAGNMGVVRPTDEFMKELRQICNEENIVLIFDEVMTGFRLSAQGAQGILNVKPDMVTFGKIIGGGLPVGAFGGKREIMEKLAPTGDVYQAGTLSGNPLAMSAGLTTLNILKIKKVSFSALDEKTNHLCRQIESLFTTKGIAVCINRVHSMFTIFFQQGPVYDLNTAQKSDTALFARFFHGMLKRGVWLAPSQYEAGFLSFAHTNRDVDRTIDACSKTLKIL